MIPSPRSSVLALPILAVLFVSHPSLRAAASTGASQDVQEPGPIEDNSFLLEEAYNQEEGVVQHISTFVRDWHEHGWAYSFTQEWPAPGRAHQISLTILAVRPGGNEGSAGFGDLGINYRYMALGSEGGKVAFAPRASLFFATGDSDEGRSDGGPGLQFNLPLSVKAGGSIVLHSNVGALRVWRGRNEAGDSADLDAVWAGQSVIWLARPVFNLMLEMLWSRYETIVGESDTERRTGFILSPGARFAINRPSGLQIVPGIAFPIQLLDDEAEHAVLLYLSFEHFFGSAAPARD